MPQPSTAMMTAAAPLNLETVLALGKEKRRRTRALVILWGILVALVAFQTQPFWMNEFYTNNMLEGKYWHGLLVQLVFPSKQVTATKVACVVLGLTLTLYHFLILKQSCRKGSCWQNLLLLLSRSSSSSSVAKSRSSPPPISSSKKLHVVKRAGFSGVNSLRHSAHTQKLRLTLPSTPENSQTNAFSPLLNRENATSFDEGPSSEDEQYAAELDRLMFELPLWIERVDPVLGKRKVSYLLTVTEQFDGDKHQPAFLRRYSAIRSAATVKLALLVLEDNNDHSSGRSNNLEFKRLHAESREYLYNTIDDQTEAVAQQLQLIAARRSAHPTELKKKAMLYHCLTSTSKLPSMRHYQDVGIQMSPATRNELEIIWEGGLYRLHSPRFLRQEWCLLTKKELHFLRSYSVRACKVIPIAHVLRAQAVDETSLLNDEWVHASPQNGFPGHKNQDIDDQRKVLRMSSSASFTRWYAIQVHLITEIVTVFVESPDERVQFIAALTQLQQQQTKPPPPIAIDNLSAPFCLNQRNLLGPIPSPFADLLESTSSKAPPKVNTKKLNNIVESHDNSQTNGLVLVQEILKGALQTFALKPEQRKPQDILRVLDGVELLNHLDLFAKPLDWLNTHEAKFAFALNLYHLMFIHAMLVFGPVETHQQWKKMQCIPCYRIGSDKYPDRQVRLTLEAIEHRLLRTKLQPAFRAKFSLTSIPNSTDPFFLPPHLVTSQVDFRTSLVLQMNCSPTTTVMRVYHGNKLLDEQLNDACAQFLESELQIDSENRIISLPKVCEWYQNDMFDQDKRGVVGNLLGSREFFILQQLMGFMTDAQHHQVQHLLLGSGEEAQIRYNRFWTHETTAFERMIISGLELIKLPSFTDGDGNNEDPTTSSIGVAGVARDVKDFFQSFF